MDINALGAQYLNQPYVPFSSSTGTMPGAAPASLGSSGIETRFADMLERAAEQSAAQLGYDTNTQILQGGEAEIDKNSQLYELCQEFETFLLKILISSMRNTVQKSELIDTGFAGQFYEDMLYDEYAKDFAKNSGFGFAELAYLELSGQRGKALAAKRPDF